MRNVTSRKQRNMLKRKEICHQTENNVKKNKGTCQKHTKKTVKKTKKNVK